MTPSLVVLRCFRGYLRHLTRRPFYAARAGLSHYANRMRVANRLPMFERKFWPNGERIRQLRESKQWSQFDMELRILDLVDSLKDNEAKQLATCSKKTIEDAENCRHRITERKLKAMATVLG